MTTARMAEGRGLEPTPETIARLEAEARAELEDLAPSSSAVTGCANHAAGEGPLTRYPRPATARGQQSRGLRPRGAAPGHKGLGEIRCLRAHERHQHARLQSLLNATRWTFDIAVRWADA
jgi:hypothetical protein